MEREKLVSVKVKVCPRCGGRSFSYHPPEERQIYKDKVIVGMYGCTNCSWQSGLGGEV